MFILLQYMVVFLHRLQKIVCTYVHSDKDLKETKALISLITSMRHMFIK